MLKVPEELGHNDQVEIIDIGSEDELFVSEPKIIHFKV